MSSVFKVTSRSSERPTILKHLLGCLCGCQNSPAFEVQSGTRNFQEIAHGSGSLRDSSGQGERDANQLVQEKSSEAHCCGFREILLYSFADR